jgi:hypothetical protein
MSDGHAPPTARQHLESARKLLEFADGHVAALARVMQDTAAGLHDENVQPHLLADLELWQRVQALARDEITTWSADGDG